MDNDEGKYSGVCGRDKKQLRVTGIGLRVKVKVKGKW